MKTEKEVSKVDVGNRLIAEFMGTPAKWQGYPNPQLNRWEVNRNGISTFLQYHISWDWLMPVVEKIEGMTVKGSEDISYNEYPEIREVEWQFSIVISNGGCTIDREVLPQYHGTEEDFLKLYSCLKKDKIKSTWIAVIKFIQHYNTLTPKREVKP